MVTDSLNLYVFSAINKFLTINNLFKYIYIYIYTHINTFFHTSIHTHNPPNTSSIYIKKTSKHHKYHFHPPTITPTTQYMYHLFLLTPILLSTHLYYLLILPFFARIKNRPQHSTFNLFTTYTLPFLQ